MERRYQLLFYLVVEALMLTSFLATGNFQLDIEPTQIETGISDSLNIKCTITVSNHPNMAALISLIISRSTSAGETFTELATINGLTGQVNKLTTNDANIDGSFESTVESFINMKWDYPTDAQAGEYKCTAHGFDSLGNIIVLSDVVQVTANQPSVDDFKNKVKDMDAQLKDLKQLTSQILQRTSNLERTAEDLDQNIATVKSEVGQINSNITFLNLSLEDEVLRLKTNENNLQVRVVSLEERPLGPKDLLSQTVGMFESPLLYNSRKYYISKDRFISDNGAIEICKSYGGWLVEIDDARELQAIQKFVNTTSGIHCLYIAGSDRDHEGTWVLQSNNQALPFTEWAFNRPYTNHPNDCLTLCSPDWKMYDNACHYNFPITRRYMCEVPDN